MGLGVYEFGSGVCSVFVVVVVVVFVCLFFCCFFFVVFFVLFCFLFFSCEDFEQTDSEINR